MSLIGQAHTVPSSVILWGVQDLGETIVRGRPMPAALCGLEQPSICPWFRSHGISGELSGIGDRSMKMSGPYPVQPPIYRPAHVLA